MFGIHRDMEALRRRAARLSHALASARRAARASARRTDQLLTALSASLPLPPDLLLALRRGVGADLAGAAQDTEGEAGVPAAEGVVRAEGRPQRKGRQGREEEEGAGSDGEVGRKTGREGTRRGLAASAGAARSLFATGKRRGTLEDAKGSGREVDGSWSEEEEEEEAGIDDAALEAAEREREEREQMFGAALLAMRDVSVAFCAGWMCVLGHGATAGTSCAHEGEREDGLLGGSRAIKQFQSFCGEGWPCMLPARYVECAGSSWHVFLDFLQYCSAH